MLRLGLKVDVYTRDPESLPSPLTLAFSERELAPSRYSIGLLAGDSAEGGL